MQECKLKESSEKKNSKVNKSREADFLIACIFSIWIAGTFAGRLLSELYFKESTALKIVISSLTLLWPFVFFIFSSYRVAPNNVSSGDKVAFTVLAVFGLLSCMISPVMLHSTSFFLITFFAVFIILQFKTNMRPVDIELSLILYSIITTVILLLVVKYDYAVGYRLGMRTGILNANSIGLIGMSVVITASAIKYQLIRYPIILIAVVVIYLTGSRAAMLASIIGFIVVNKYRVDALNKHQKILFWCVFTISVGIVVGYYVNDILMALESFFKFTDSHRGLESGGSGRTVIWGWIWELFLQNPIFGVGFRAHGELIDASSAHNGYLATLVDIGVFGFIAVMYLVLSGVYRLWKKLSDRDNIRAYTTLFSLVVAYMSLAMFERYLINVGNPASLLFMLSVFGKFREVKGEDH